MKHSYFSACLGICLWLGACLAVSAQTTALVISATSLDKEAKATTTKTYIKDSRMLTETSGNKQENLMLFDADEEILYIINHKKKEVTEMTREDMEAMSAMIKEQMAMLDQQLEMMPESQRKMLREKVSAAYGQQHKPAEYTLKESGTAVKNWKADKYVGMADGKKQSEMYIASYEQLKLDKNDFKTVEKFYQLMKGFAQSLSKSVPGTAMSFISESMPAYEKGIPVKSVLYDAREEATHTMLVEEIGEKEVDEAVFDIPEDYKRKKMADTVKGN